MNAQVIELRPRSEPWITKKQIAEHYGMSQRWVELRVKDGMPSRKVGRAIRFRLSDVDQWLLRRTA